ncbi:hypothetical protein Sm713_07740 [Streptomyces sp. TS71-3]|nr:hypothetical protein Sm713_07740 [Streptomyces sp. TS71-3]
MEVSADVRHYLPGHTMAQYGKRRAQGARKPASGTGFRGGAAHQAGEAPMRMPAGWSRGPILAAGPHVDP